MNEKPLVLAIDFNNVAIGSYYGEKIINSKGEGINAIKGFFFKLKTLKDTFNPDYIVMANDLSRNKTFRRKMYKPYKAQRKPLDPDIVNQLKRIQQMARLIGYPFINNELFEADDILGMIGKFATEKDWNTVIVSSDKDLYQLINKNTYIFSYKNGELIDEDTLKGKYGLTPSQWIDLKILQGDRGDNVPGINGIGEVTALKLLNQYGSIDSIYSHMGYYKPKLKDMLRSGEHLIPLIRDLVTIDTDYLKINLTEDMLKMDTRFEQEVYELIEELEIYPLFNIMNYSLFIDKNN